MEFEDWAELGYRAGFLPDDYKHYCGTRYSQDATLAGREITYDEVV